MNTKPFEELLQAYLEGSLSEAEWQALAQDLATSEPHRAELARHVVLDAMLQQVGEPALDRELILRALPDSKATKLSLRVTRAIRNEPAVQISSAPILSGSERRSSGPRRLWRPLLALAASLLALVGGYLLLMPRPDAAPEVRVAEVRGKVSGFRCQGSGGPESGVLSPTGLQVGDMLKPGDSVEVGADGYAKLAYTDATQVELRQNTRLRVTRGAGWQKDAKRLALDGGTLVCTAAPQQKPFRIETRFAVAEVVGTQFRLGATSIETELAVQQGKVALCQGANRLVVNAGETAVADAAGMRRLSSEDLWLRELLVQAGNGPWDVLDFGKSKARDKLTWLIENRAGADRRIWQTDATGSGIVKFEDYNKPRWQRGVVVGRVMLLPKGDLPPLISAPPTATRIPYSAVNGPKGWSWQQEDPRPPHASLFFYWFDRIKATSGWTYEFQPLCLYPDKQERGVWLRFAAYFEIGVSNRAFSLCATWPEGRGAPPPRENWQFERPDENTLPKNAQFGIGLLAYDTPVLWQGIKFVPLGPDMPQPPAGLLK